jgi:cytochrome c
MLYFSSSTTGDVLNNDQHRNLKDTSRQVVAILGIHAASDCEYDWPWYGKTCWAWFLDHSNVPKQYTEEEILCR